MTPRRRQAGFSLLELLVAMVIMAMSLGLLYQASTGALRGLGDYAQQHRATLLAQSLLDARDAVPAQGWNESGQSAGFAWRVTSRAQPLPAGLNAGTPLLHEIAISISWQGRLGQRTVELRTLLPQERNLQVGAS